MKIDKIADFSIINGVSKVSSRADRAERPFCEESPGSAGQDNGERPPEATLGQVQQRYTAVASAAVRVERRGKSSPIP